VMSWSLASWRSKPAQHQPSYVDENALVDVLSQLSHMPPLVVWSEIEALKEQIAGAQRGERFVLQAGDCAESFDECDSESISKKLRILLQMSLVLLHGL